MKSIFSALISFAVSSIFALAAPVPQGFIIYTDPPSSYVNGAEFTSYVQGNSAYSTIVKIDSASGQVWNSGLIGIVNYPTSQSSEADAIQELQAIQALQRKCPQEEFRAYFQGASARWQNALIAARQVAKVAAPSPRADDFSLVVDGTKYEGVTLTGTDNESVSITHSDGVARIPISALSQEQITLLNSTTTSIQIDPNWLVKWKAKQLAATEAQRVANAAAVNGQQNTSAITTDVRQLQNPTADGAESSGMSSKTAPPAPDPKKLAQGWYGYGYGVGGVMIAASDTFGIPPREGDLIQWLKDHIPDNLASYKYEACLEGYNDRLNGRKAKYPEIDGPAPQDNQNDTDPLPRLNFP